MSRAKPKVLQNFALVQHKVFFLVAAFQLSFFEKLPHQGPFQAPPSKATLGSFFRAWASPKEAWYPKNELYCPGKWAYRPGILALIGLLQGGGIGKKAVGAALLHHRWPYCPLIAPGTKSGSIAPQYGSIAPAGLAGAIGPYSGAIEPYVEQ